jgi:hypothetical protein
VCNSNRDVDLLVQLRANAQSGKGLSRPLTETNAAETWCASDMENIGMLIGITVDGRFVSGIVAQ